MDFFLFFFFCFRRFLSSSLSSLSSDSLDEYFFFFLFFSFLSILGSSSIPILGFPPSRAASSRALLLGSKLLPSTKYSLIPNASLSCLFFFFLSLGYLMSLFEYRSTKFINLSKRLFRNFFCKQHFPVGRDFFFNLSISIALFF